VALGDLEAARRLLQQATATAATEAVPLANLGIVCLRMGDQACALDSLRKAAAMAPDDIVVRASLADVLYLTDGAAAEEQYRKVLQRAPEYGPALGGLASVLLQRRDAKGAAPVITKALVALPDDPVVQVNAAVLAELQGAPDRAIDHYRKALALDPSYALAWYDLGLLLDRLGRAAEARAAYESYLQNATDPDEAAYIRYRLSKVATTNAPGPGPDVQESR
jgi:Flp pilus assembly protein TadD